MAETATEKGSRLQETLTKTAKQADFLVIGPKRMGIQNPKPGISSQITQTNFDPEVRLKRGKRRKGQ